MDNLKVIYCLIDINKLIFSRALGTIKKERNEKVLYAVAIESDDVENYRNREYIDALIRGKLTRF